jgi:hypothetical protein
MYQDHPHPAVRVVAEKLRCGNCGTRPGRGLAITSIEHPEPYIYRIRTRCVLCGSIGAVGFTTENLEPGELDPSAVIAVFADDLIDSEIDVHRMTDDEFAAGWAKVTSK